MKTYIIYGIKFGREMYIGRTTNIKGRLASHKSRSTNLKLRKFIRKYGWNKVDVKIIKTGLSTDEGIIQERFYIGLIGTANTNKFTATSYEVEAIRSMIPKYKREEISRLTGVPPMIISNIKRGHGYK